MMNNNVYDCLERFQGWLHAIRCQNKAIRRRNNRIKRLKHELTAALAAQDLLCGILEGKDKIIADGKLCQCPASKPIPADNDMIEKWIGKAVRIREIPNGYEVRDVTTQDVLYTYASTEFKNVRS